MSVKYTERQIAQAAIYLAAVVSKARLAKQVRDQAAAGQEVQDGE